jgi:hypothetical protein
VERTPFQRNGAKKWKDLESPKSRLEGILEHYRIHLLNFSQMLGHVWYKQTWERFVVQGDLIWLLKAHSFPCSCLSVVLFLFFFQVLVMKSREGLTQTKQVLYHRATSPAPPSLLRSIIGIFSAMKYALMQ